MKKITYLVAPLMVLPFLVGCNKGGKTHNVYVSELSSVHLKFTDKDGKEINPDNPAKATEGQDFVFNVEAKEEQPNGVYEVHKDYVFALSGVDGIQLDFKFEQTEKTSAKCTIAGKDITADIALAGMEYLEGYYLVDFPYILGAEVLSFYTLGDVEPIYEEGNWYGYAPKGETLYIDFTPYTGYSVPKADNIVLMRDLGNIEQPADGTWATYSVDAFGIGELSIDPTNDAVKESLFIAARGADSSILDLLSWAEIKDISDSGYAKDLFELGEEKTIDYKGHDHKVRIIGFDADEYRAEGQDPIKYGITFQFATVISDEAGNAKTINWNDSTSKGTNYNFVESTLNKTLQGEVYDNLQPELKACIGEVTKKVGVYSTADKKWEAKDYNAKLFPLAYSEAYYQKATYETEGEGTEYAFYSESTEYYTTLRRLTDANGKTTAYWERSPHTVASDDQYAGKKAFAVGTDGSVNSNGKFCYNHGNEYGMAPAFCI